MDTALQLFRVFLLDLAKQSAFKEKHRLERAVAEIEKHCDSRGFTRWLKTEIGTARLGGNTDRELFLAHLRELWAKFKKEYMIKRKDV